MKQFRSILLTLLCLVLLGGLVAAATAWRGQAQWGDARWYFTSDPNYRLRLGQAALRGSNPEEGRDRADQITLLLEASGFKDHAALLRGETYFRQGKLYAEANDLAQAGPPLSRAVIEFNKIRDQGALRLQAAALLGQCFVYLKQANEARAAFEFVLSQDPDNIDAHRGLAAIYFDQGALRSALDHLGRVSELDLRDGRPHRLMGLICKDLEQFGPAVEAYREALSRDLRGQDPNAVRKELAECLVKTTKYADALEILGQFEPSPEDAPMLEALTAECLHNLGRTSEAREHLDRSLREYPNGLELLRLRAKLYMEDRDPAAAVPLLVRALELDRHDYASRYQLSLAYEALHQSAKAAEQQRLLKETQKQLDELTRLNQEASDKPFDRGTRLKLAALCDALDKPREAAMWRQAAAACPPSPEMPASPSGSNTTPR